MQCQEHHSPSLATPVVVVLLVNGYFVMRRVPRELGLFACDQATNSGASKLVAPPPVERERNGSTEAKKNVWFL